MAQNGDSTPTAIETKLADLNVKDSTGAEEKPKDVSPSTPSAGEQKVIAKFLMSNPAAGSIIGKGGANISELQSQSGARLQLSRANEFFPGTQDRVMLASGSVNQVLTALHLIWSKIQGEQVGPASLNRHRGIYAAYSYVYSGGHTPHRAGLLYFDAFAHGLNSKTGSYHRVPLFGLLWFYLGERGVLHAPGSVPMRIYGHVEPPERARRLAE